MEYSIMQYIALVIVLAALFLLYRIAYPKQSTGETKKSVSHKKSKSEPIPDIMGKSRFVLPSQKEPLPTPIESQIVVKENEKKFPAVIPVEELDKVFADNQNDDVDFEEEEAEEYQQGGKIAYADGVTFNDLQTAVKVINEQPKEVSNETVHVIKSLENTELFDLLVADNESKQSWIKSVVERNFDKGQSEVVDDEVDMAVCDSFISNFLPE